MTDEAQNKLLAPTGPLRVAINLGNPILARRGDGGALEGISVDLARALGRRYGLEIALHPVDPARGAGVAFTAPYLLIEGWYLRN